NFPIGIEGVEQPEGGRKYSQRCVQVALEEGISVAITSVGPPNIYTKLLKDAGVKVLHAVSTPSQAEKAEQLEVDAVVCEGHEGGGHKATTELTTMAMIPMVADRVKKIPIIAAGGIADARGFVASLALGADGVYVGTRFMATVECDVHPRVKQAVLKCSDTGTLSINKVMVNERALKNSFSRKYAEMQARGASIEELMRLLSEHTMYRGLVEGDTDEGDIPCGQDAGLIARLLSAAEVIKSIVGEIPSVLSQIEAKTRAAPGS
ncbi:MAG: nitronate monooxygenase family protein, partial [Chloroflexi bacterium]|nr:nitronate monooxygenase family protein [Chloroflexota bacterium]